MYLTTAQLTDLIRTLETVRRDSPCQQKRDGERTFLPKPRTKRRAGHVYSNGDTLVANNGTLGIWIEPGIHGRAFVGVDPTTGEIACAECAMKGGA